MRRVAVSSRDAKKSRPVTNFVKKADFRPNQSLKVFSCPLCLSPDSLQIKLSVSKGKGEATLTCIRCIRAAVSSATMSSSAITYPFKMSFLPKLQKKSDVFFKFRDFVQQSDLGGANSGGSENMLQPLETSSIAPKDDLAVGVVDEDEYNDEDFATSDDDEEETSQRDNRASSAGVVKADHGMPERGDEEDDDGIDSLFG